MDNKTNKKNKIIYHYTTFANFINIVQTKKLWFGEIGSSNDTVEGKWFIESLREKKDRDLYKKFQKLQQEDNTISFKGCFCNSKDNLSLWRGYSDDAKGIALGFEIQDIENKNDIKNPNQDLISSIVISEIEYYNILSKKIKTILKNQTILIDKLTSFLQNQEKKPEVEKQLLNDLFIRHSNTIKHNCFKNEKEIAVIATIEKNNLQKCQETLVINKNNKFLFPVLEIKEPTNVVKKLSSSLGIKKVEYYHLVLKEIVIGSKNSASKETITSILKINGFNNIKISKSKLPYK